MPRWTFPATDLATGRLFHEDVEFSGVRFSDSLDGGTFSGTIKAGQPGLPIWPRDNIWHTMVWPCRDGQPQGAFVITSVQFDLASPAATVTGARFDALLEKRELRHDLNFTAVDQLDIARDLIRYGIGEPLSWVSPVVGDTAASVKSVPWFRYGTQVSGIDRTIKVTTNSATDEGFGGTDGKFIGPLLRGLADASPQPGEGVKVGFEIRADYGVDPDGGDYWAKLSFGYPTIGRAAGSPNKIYLEYGAAIASAQYGADGQDFATRARVVGKERDGKRPTGTATNSTLLGFGYTLLDRNVTSGAITESANLNDRAATLLYRQSRITSAWNVTLSADKGPTWSTYRIGDHVVLRAEWGGRQMADQTLRLTGWDITVDDTHESETIVPTLMEP